jgi:hypothetical protein
MGMAQHARRQGLAKFGWNYYNYKNFCRMMYMGKTWHGVILPGFFVLL